MGASLSAIDLLGISECSPKLPTHTRRAPFSEVQLSHARLLAPEIESLFESTADEKKSALQSTTTATSGRASPHLRPRARELRGSQGELVKLLERLIAS